MLQRPNLCFYNDNQFFTSRKEALLSHLLRLNYHSQRLLFAEQLVPLTALPLMLLVERLDLRQLVE